MVFFISSGKKKNPSMYRRPSELGLSTTPMADQSEVRSNYQPVAMGRQHIVKPIPDHKETYQAAVEEWQEENVKETESTSHYKNLAPKRPVCQKLADHLTLGVSISFYSIVFSKNKEEEYSKPSRFMIHYTYSFDHNISRNFIII